MAPHIPAIFTKQIIQSTTHDTVEQHAKMHELCINSEGQKQIADKMAEIEYFSKKKFLKHGVRDFVKWQRSNDVFLFKLFSSSMRKAFHVRMEVHAYIVCMYRICRSMLLSCKCKKDILFFVFLNNFRGITLLTKEG